MIKNKRGMVMPLVLMTLLILSLLGVVLLQYSVADSKQVAIDQQQLQAYYLARSGADAVAQHILNNPAQAATLISANKSSPVSLGSGNFEVLVFGNPESEILIEATGTVTGVSQKATLSIVKLNLFDVALAANSITITGNAARIYGNVTYKTTFIVPPGVIPSPWTATQNISLYYPPATFPSDAGLALIPVNGSMEFSGQQTESISVSSRGTLIEMKNNNHKLNVHLGSSTHEDRVLRVDTFKLNGGDLTLHGKGRLLLYIPSLATYFTNTLYVRA